MSDLSTYSMPRTDLHGWRLKIGEDNHGQHKWVYLPEGPAREAWPQTKMDKYAIGLEMVHQYHSTHDICCARRRE
jgi:lanosterol synthase